MVFADPGGAVAAAHAADGDALAGSVIGKAAGGQPLFHIATAILGVVVHHIPARAIFLGGVGADDVGECPQRDPLMPDPAKQGEQQDQQQ
ncbi:hypothetical protein D3C71_2036900 [compost metagenome]